VKSAVCDTILVNTNEGAGTYQINERRLLNFGMPLDLLEKKMIDTVQLSKFAGLEP
jgi:hypothetical protein